MTTFDSSHRETYLTEKLTSYLERKTSPRGRTEQANVDELASLTRCLKRYAPQNGYEDWWCGFEDRLDENAVTRAWPTVREIKLAAGAGTSPSRSRIADGCEIDPLNAIAKQINAGKEIPEAHLYGPLADQLLATGKVTESQLLTYRNGCFAKYKEAYGEDYAQKKVAELRSRHSVVQRAGIES